MGLPRRGGAAPRALAAWFTAGLVALAAAGEEAPAAAEAASSGGEAPAAAEAASGEDDPTKELLKQLTISMVSEVVDERTVLIRDSAKVGRKLLRMGNTAAPERGSQSEAEHEEKKESSTGALRQLVGKQMIWWKAAADEFQPTGEDPSGETVVLADLWLMDGRHIPTMLVAEGHLAKAEHYAEELARNILTAESEAAKKESYKELEEAIKESQKYKAEEAKEASKAAKAKAEADMPVEGIGMGGWVGIIMLVGIVGAAFFLTPEKKKKVNLNRKRGLFEKVWSKLKGA